MKKFFKWVASLFKSQPKAPKTIAEMANTMISLGKGNTTTVSQVKIIKNKPLLELSEDQLSEIASRAVQDVAKQKLVTQGQEERIREWMKEDITERHAVKTSPGPNAKPLKAEELKKAVTASKQRSATKRVSSDADSYRRRNDDAMFINTTAISDTYTTHTSSHSSGSDSYSSCDSSSSSSGSCD